MLLLERTEHLLVERGMRVGARGWGGLGGGRLAEALQLLVFLRLLGSEGLHFRLCALQELLRLGLRLCALPELAAQGGELGRLRVERVGEPSDLFHV